MAEGILHWGAVTLRVTGSGNLRMHLTGLDNAITKTLVPIVMSDTSGREPTRLSNFNSQRTKIKLQTTAINEVMRINRIILWTKPIYTQFPG